MTALIAIKVRNHKQNIIKEENKPKRRFEHCRRLK
jgi:hypothetical protein